MWSLSLYCLMTPGLGKDIQCHVWPYSFLCLRITRVDIRPQEKWAVSLVIADGNLIFFGVCVGMSGLICSCYDPQGLHVKAGEACYNTENQPHPSTKAS